MLKNLGNTQILTGSSSEFHETLKVGDRYLVKQHDDIIHEFRLERITEKCFLFKIIDENKLIWVDKNCVIDRWGRKYHFFEKLDPSYYREKKLKKILNTEDEN